MINNQNAPVEAGERHGNAQYAQNNRILIKGRKGGLFLDNTSYENFCNAAIRLVAQEVNEGSEATFRSFYVQILPYNEEQAQTWCLEVGTTQSQVTYEDEIVYALRETNARILVHKNMNWPMNSLNSEPESKYIKVIRTGIGYYNAFSGWSLEQHSLQENSKFFINSAIRCLFSLKINETSGVFMVGKINLKWHAIDLSCNVAVDKKTQEFFGELLSLKDLAEILILQEPMYKIVGPAGREIIKYTPPINFERFLFLIEDQLFPKYGISKNWKVAIIYNNEAWQTGRRLGPIGEVFGEDKLLETYSVQNGRVEKKLKLMGAFPKEIWNDWKATYFKPNEIIRIIRCFDYIRVCNGTDIGRSYYDWRTINLYGTPDTYGSIAFDSERILSEMAKVAIEVLGRDPRKPGQGIKILGHKYKENSSPKWGYLNDKMSPINFLHQFVGIDNDTITIFPDHVHQQPESPSNQTTDRSDKENHMLLSRRGAELKQRRIIEADQRLRSTKVVAPLKSIAEPLKEFKAPKKSILRKGFVYGSPEKEAALPGDVPLHNSTFESEIYGGPDMPSLYGRLLTLRETRSLQVWAMHLENQINCHEEVCRVCGMTFEFGSADVAKHYKQHELVSGYSCPYCSKDWTRESRQDQINHLESNHRLQHAQTGRERRISDDELETERSSTKSTRTKLFLGKENEGQSSLQSPARKHQNRQSSVTEDHDGEHISELENPVSASFSPSDQEKDEHGRPKKVKGLYYHCNKCFVNLNNQNVKKQKEHVQNCGTSLDMMLAIPTEEGRQMRKVQKKSDHKPQLLFKDKKSGQNFPKPQSTLRTRSQNLNREAETQLVGESKNKTLNPVNGKKKNQKRAGSAGPPTSRKRRHG